MCRTTAYRSTTCNHRWLTITARCAPNVGFTTTPIHEFRSDGAFVWGKPKFERAPAGSCPNCDKKGQYDGNTTRMVLGSGNREVQRNLWRGARQEAMMGGGMVGVNPYQGTIAPPPFTSMNGTNTNGQALTAYQQQFAANQQGAQWVGHGRGVRHMPVAQRYTYGYGNGPGHSSRSVM